MVTAVGGLFSSLLFDARVNTFTVFANVSSLFVISTVLPALHVVLVVNSMVLNSGSVV